MSLRADELRDLAVRLRIGTAAFERWASQFPGCPSNPAALVFDVDVHDDYFGILTTTWEGRRARWTSVPCNARTLVSTPPSIAEGMIDPWTTDERDVRARSEHVAICERCAGAGKATCITCNGAGNLICETCNGQRKQYGYAANGSHRLLNCTTCRGKGEVDCPDCRRGIAVCSVCAGEKRVQRWIAIERWQRAAAAEHPSWMKGLEQQGETALTIDRPRALTRADLGGVAPEWLERLSAGAAQPGERIARQQLRMIRVPRLTVHYRLGDEDQTAEFSGAGLAPLQSAAPAAFAMRARRLRAMTALLATGGIVAAIFWLSRGVFFWSAWSFGAIAAMAACLALLRVAAAEHTAARRHTMRWVNGAFAALIAMLICGALAMPRASDVRKRIAAGDLDGAERELQLLGDADAALQADLHLARLRRARDLAAARGELAAIPRNLPQFAAAAALVEARAAAEIKALRAEAERRTADAKASFDVAERLRKSRMAEESWAALDRAGDDGAETQLIAVRTSMARDIATLERRRRGD